MQMHMLLVVIGLYLVVDNSRIQEFLVKLIGTHTAIPVTTGAIHRLLATRLGT